MHDFSPNDPSLFLIIEGSFRLKSCIEARNSPKRSKKTSERGYSVFEALPGKCSRMHAQQSCCRVSVVQLYLHTRTVYTFVYLQHGTVSYRYRIP